MLKSLGSLLKMGFKWLTGFQLSFSLIIFLSVTSVGKQRGEQGVNDMGRKN